MSEPTAWRELHRCDDLLQARAVVTAIAAMEFDARIHAAGAPADEEPNSDDEQAPQDFPGPYIIQVQAADWPTLKESLDEIIREQTEFDHMIETMDQGGTFGVVKLIVIIALIIGLLGVYQLIAFMNR